MMVYDLVLHNYSVIASASKDISIMLTKATPTPELIGIGTNTMD